MQVDLLMARRLLCSAAVLFATVGSAEAAPCLGELKRALIAGGFSGSVDCAHDRLSVREIGRVHIRERRFIVYDYTYKLRPVCDGCAVHGGQRILIFDRRRYLGQYKTDFARVSLDGDKIIFRPSLKLGSRVQTYVVRVTYRGVPKRVFADGEMVSFFR